VLESRHADARRVTVWLPSSYRPGGPRHAVLYMHDGQNLFDTATGFGGMEWKVDEVLDRLIREREVRPTVVVGIWNTEKAAARICAGPRRSGICRRPYMDRVRSLYGGEPLSDGYLRFIVAS
jgi:enterochelin esterase-like enzyme